MLSELKRERDRKTVRWPERGGGREQNQLPRGIIWLYPCPQEGGDFLSNHHKWEGQPDWSSLCQGQPKGSMCKTGSSMGQQWGSVCQPGGLIVSQGGLKTIHCGLRASQGVKKPVKGSECPSRVSERKP